MIAPVPVHCFPITFINCATIALPMRIVEKLKFGILAVSWDLSIFYKSNPSNRLLSQLQKRFPGQINIFSEIIRAMKPKLCTNIHGTHLYIICV